MIDIARRLIHKGPQPQRNHHRNRTHAEIRQLKQENAELRRVNEILKTASAYFVRRTAPFHHQMISFIDTYKETYGVEPICTVLNENIEGGFLTPSSYYKAKKRVPAAHTLKDQLLIPELTKIHEENYSVYGVRKMWHAMVRAGWDIGRDQTYRLMKLAGVAGAHRGRKPMATKTAKVIEERTDLVRRDFTTVAPNRFLVADFTYRRTY